MKSSRIIILSDIYDVRGTGGLKFRSHFLNDDERDHMIRTGSEPSHRYNFWSRYMGPYVVASNVREHTDYEVVVLDYFTKLDNFFDYFECFVTPETEYVALSLTFLNNPFNPIQGDFNLWHWTHEECCAWFEELKRRAPKAKILIGGAMVDTIFKQHFLMKSKRDIPYAMQKYVDYAFHGYSERTIIDFLNNNLLPEQIYEKQGVKFIDEPALAGKGAIITDTKWNSQDAVQNGEWLPIEMSKGCRFGCKFCFYDHSGTIIKDKDVLRKELIYNYEKFGVTGYHFTDDTINDSMKKIDDLHEVITNLPFDIEWVSYARPDMFHKYPQMLDRMLEMGCRGMFLGVETLNHTAAKIAGKGLHPDKIKGILEWIRATAGEDIFMLTSFIIGLVGETEESLMDTVGWLKEQRVIDKAQYELLFVTDSGGRTKNDFSDNKDKFGIREIRWDPEYYWRHDTMDLTQAKEIALKWEQTMSNHPYTQMESHLDYNVSFWAYPRLRSFGMGHKEAKDTLCGLIPDEVYRKNMNWIKDYHKCLARSSHTLAIAE
jgi:radical SAM superfamily enzyme YgiQ (UPF0313 family)